MKVLIVVPHLRTGGGQQLAIDEAIFLSKQKNFEVTILSIGTEEDNIFTQKAKKNNLRVLYINKNRGKSFKAFFKTLSFIRKENPDIVHTHLLAMPYTMLSAFFDRKTKYFHTIHNIADKEARSMEKIERFAYKFTNFTPIGISDYCVKTICDFYKLSPEDVPIIYNGIDTSRFVCKKRYRDRKEKLTIISTGRMEPVKRHTLMVEAFSEVIKAGYDAQLVFLGDGILRPEVEKCIRKLGIEENVVLKGITDKVEDELNNAHIYLMASEHEGLPLSVLEAMSCGLPVVATKAGGTIDIVNETNGILCDIDNKEQISNALIRLVSDAELREKMSDASLAIASNYDIHKCIGQYAELFEKEIKKRTKK